MMKGMRRNPVNPMLGFSRKHYIHQDKRKQVKHRKMMFEGY